MYSPFTYILYKFYVKPIIFYNIKNEHVIVQDARSANRIYQRVMGYEYAKKNYVLIQKISIGKRVWKILTCIDACVIRTLPSAVTSTDESDTNGAPFLSHCNVGLGTPLGTPHRISDRPPASTLTDCGGTENCFFISGKK